MCGNPSVEIMMFYRGIMDTTGASSWRASDAIYGVITTCTDISDWTKIENSTDPLSVSQFATLQIYDEHLT